MRRYFFCPLSILSKITPLPSTDVCLINVCYGLTPLCEFSTSLDNLLTPLLVVLYCFFANVMRQICPLNNNTIKNSTQSDTVTGIVVECC